MSRETSGSCTAAEASSGAGSRWAARLQLSSDVGAALSSSTSRPLSGRCSPRWAYARAYALCGGAVVFWSALVEPESGDAKVETVAGAASVTACCEGAPCFLACGATGEPLATVELMADGLAMRVRDVPEALPKAMRCAAAGRQGFAAIGDGRFVLLTDSGGVYFWSDDGAQTLLRAGAELLSLAPRAGVPSLVVVVRASNQRADYRLQTIQLPLSTRRR